MNQQLNFDTNNSEQKPDNIMRYKSIKVFTDGGARGNPGPAAAGYVLLTPDDKIITKRGAYLGVATNNQAEYRALAFALQKAKDIGALNVEVYMDSMLIVNQMKGLYKVKNQDLKPIFNTIKEISTSFNQITFTHVPREQNKLADREVNIALDNATAN